MSEYLELEKSYEFLGTWWLPSNPENKHHGVLKLSPEGITLELAGEGQRFLDLFVYTSETHGPFVGILPDGRLITLTDSFSSNPSSSSSGWHTANIIANLCILGAHFDSDSKIKFDNINICLSHFEKWLEYSPFKQETFF